jgi:hypothetical protein
MAEDSLFENLVKPFISAPAKIRLNTGPLLCGFFDAGREAGIVTHLLNRTAALTSRDI